MSTSTPIRVILVDDHQHIHDAVAKILRTSAGISLVGQGYNGEDALALCKTVQPDVVLMDVMMPIMDGIAATRKIRELYPDIRVLVISSIFDHESVYAMLKGGADGYVVKGDLPRALEDTIHATHNGTMVFSPEVAHRLTFASTDHFLEDFNLTDRELEVLGHLAGGLTFKEIASRLSISVSTVKFHTNNVQEKLGVTTRTEALVVAAKNNLV